MGIFLREFTVSNIFSVGDATLRWVENPYDINEQSPSIIGIVGTNCSGKSTMLSRVFSWLAHPDSNNLGFNDGRPIDNTIFFDENIPRMNATAIFEFEGRIYEASRSLMGGATFDSNTFTLHRYDESGESKEPLSSEKNWNRIEILCEIFF